MAPEPRKNLLDFGDDFDQSGSCYIRVKLWLGLQRTLHVTPGRTVFWFGEGRVIHSNIRYVLPVV